MKGPYSLDLLSPGGMRKEKRGRRLRRGGRPPGCEGVEAVGSKVRTSDERVGGQSGQRAPLEWRLCGAALARQARRGAQLRSAAKRRATARESATA